MSRFVAALMASLTVTAPAVLAADRGEITVVGQGQATAAPEYARFTVDVTSICYESSVAAKEANATLANSVIGILRTFAVAPTDEVTATGGVNIIRTETTYVGDEPKVLCEMKWRATNTLVLQTASIDKIPELQDQVLAAVDAMAADPALVAQTYAELGQPSFHLLEATLKALKTTAQTAAFDDAKAQYDAFNAGCDFQDPQLQSITPPQYDVYARKNGDAISADTPAGTPIIPDDLAVDATWTFKWTFAQAASCPI